jgi:formylglycine-generating enzyme
MPINLPGAWQSKWTRNVACGVLRASLIAGFSYRCLHGRFAPATEPADAYCDSGIGAAPANAALNATARDAVAWNGRINDSEPPAPTGMIWIPGGQFWMGTDDEHMPDARPWHRVYVDGYWMDNAGVTNEEFAQFVDATGYGTVAERKPRAEDFPGAPPENLVEGSVVFTPPAHPVELNNHLQWWNYVHGANWRHPEGPASDIENRMNHPVVEIAYEDAVAYCKWKGKRLPTEAEFEFASRGGLDRKRYVWGGEFMPGGKHMANISGALSRREHRGG